MILAQSTLKSCNMSEEPVCMLCLGKGRAGESTLPGSSGGAQGGSCKDIRRLRPPGRGGWGRCFPSRVDLDLLRFLDYKVP